MYKTSDKVFFKVNFYSGETDISLVNEDSVGRVRCVRGESDALPEERFVNGATDETVVDTWSELEWRRCAEGQTWDGERCKGSGAAVSGDSLQTVCEGLFAGYDDWRAPAITELTSIANKCGSNPASHSAAFPDTPAAPFWSPTRFLDAMEKTWTASFGFGWTEPMTPASSARIRCVRTR